jgi:hypothetical protein
VADELAGLAQGGRRDPDRRQEVTAEQERQALRVDAIILEARGGDGLGLFGMREDRLMAAPTVTWRLGFGQECGRGVGEGIRGHSHEVVPESERPMAALAAGE